MPYDSNGNFISYEEWKKRRRKQQSYTNFGDAADSFIEQRRAEQSYAMKKRHDIIAGVKEAADFGMPGSSYNSVVQSQKAMDADAARFAGRYGTSTSRKPKTKTNDFGVTSKHSSSIKPNTSTFKRIWQGINPFDDVSLSEAVRGEVDAVKSGTSSSTPLTQIGREMQEFVDRGSIGFGDALTGGLASKGMKKLSEDPNVAKRSRFSAAAAEPEGIMDKIADYAGQGVGYLGAGAAVEKGLARLGQSSSFNALRQNAARIGGKPLSAATSQVPTYSATEQLARTLAGAGVLKGATDYFEGGRDPNIEDPSLMNEVGRGARAWTGQQVRSGGEIASWLNQDELGSKLQNKGNEMVDGFEETEPVTWKSFLDPDFYAYQFGANAPTAAAFMLPGLVGAKLGTKLGGSAASLLNTGNFGKSVMKGIGGALGGTAATVPLESAMEAGSVYEQARKRGMSEEEADAAANEVFGKNLALLGVTNATELGAAFLPMPKAIKDKFSEMAQITGRAIVGGSAEGGQELAQNKFQADALGDEFKVNTPENALSFGIGALMGGGFAVAGGIADPIDTIQRNVVAELPENLQTEFRETIEEMRRQGVQESEATSAALEELSNDPDVQKLVETKTMDVVDDIRREELNQKPFNADEFVQTMTDQTNPTKPKSSLNDSATDQIAKMDPTQSQQGIEDVAGGATEEESSFSFDDEMIESFSSMNDEGKRQIAEELGQDVADELQAEVNRRDAQPLTRKPSEPVQEGQVPDNLSAPTETATEQPTNDFSLPEQLKGAKPRYSYGQKRFQLEFENDLDRALYIVGGKGKSKQHDKYMEQLTNQTGMTEEEITTKSQTVRDQIKSMAKDGSPGMLKVPNTSNVTDQEAAPVSDMADMTTDDVNSVPEMMDQQDSQQTNSPPLPENAIPKEKQEEVRKKMSEFFNGSQASNAERQLLEQELAAVEQEMLDAGQDPKADPSIPPQLTEKEKRENKTIPSPPRKEDDGTFKLPPNYKKMRPNVRHRQGNKSVYLGFTNDLDRAIYFATSENDRREQERNMAELKKQTQLTYKELKEAGKKIHDRVEELARDTSHQKVVRVNPIVRDVKMKEQKPPVSILPIDREIQVGDTIVLKGSKQPIEVVENSDRSLLTVKNKKGKTIQTGRNRVEGFYSEGETQSATAPQEAPQGVAPSVETNDKQTQVKALQKRVSEARQEAAAAEFATRSPQFQTNKKEAKRLEADLNQKKQALDTAQTELTTLLNAPVEASSEGATFQQAKPPKYRREKTKAGKERIVVPLEDGRKVIYNAHTKETATHPDQIGTVYSEVKKGRKTVFGSSAEELLGFKVGNTTLSEVEKALKGEEYDPGLSVSERAQASEKAVEERLSSDKHKDQSYSVGEQIKKDLKASKDLNPTHIRRGKPVEAKFFKAQDGVIEKSEKDFVIFKNENGSVVGPVDKATFEKMSQPIAEQSNEPAAPTQETKQEKPKPTQAIRDNLDWLNRAADDAEKRLAKRKHDLNSLPMDMLIDYAIVGARSIATKGLDLADLTVEFVDKYGEAVRDWMPAIHAQSQAMLDYSPDRVNKMIQDATDGKVMGTPVETEEAVTSVEDVKTEDEQSKQESEEPKPPFPMAPHAIKDVDIPYLETVFKLWIRQNQLNTEQKVYDALTQEHYEKILSHKDGINIESLVKEVFPEYKTPADMRKEYREEQEGKEDIPNLFHAKAETGKPFKGKVYQGRGKSREEIYRYQKEPLLGEGEYYAARKKDAKNYGDEVKEHVVELDNPLVIKTDDQWRALAKESKWKFPNPYGSDPKEISEWIVSLKENVLSKGHDGIILDFDDYLGIESELLETLFDHMQVVKYSKNDIRIEKHRQEIEDRSQASIKESIDLFNNEQYDELFEKHGAIMQNAGPNPYYRNPFEEATGFKLPDRAKKKNEKADLIKKMKEFHKSKQENNQDVATPATKYTNLYTNENGATPRRDTMYTELYTSDETKEGKASEKKQDDRSPFQRMSDFRKKMRRYDYTAREVKEQYQWLIDNKEAAIEDAAVEIKKMPRHKNRRKKTIQDLAERYYKESIDGLMYADSESMVIQVLGEDSREKQQRAKIDGLTEEAVQAHIEKNKAQQAADQKALDNPETFQELQFKKNRKGLSEEEQVRYDEQVALRQKDNKQEQKKETAQSKATAAGSLDGQDFTIEKTKHTKTGEDLWVVKLKEKVDKDEFTRINKQMKALKGFYSRYTKGFTFKFDPTEVLNGQEVAAAEEVETQSPKTKQVEKLRQVADNMQKTIDDKLAPRKANTARRAGMAANAEAEGEQMKRVQGIMRNIANAIEAGEAVHLDGVSARTHVETLQRVLSNHRYEQLSGKGLSHNEYEEAKRKPYTDAEINSMDYPKPKIHKQNLADFFSKTEGIKGTVRLSQKIKRYTVDRAKNDDKLIDLTPVYDEMIEYISKIKGKGDFKWEIQNMEDRLQHVKRLQAMGIETKEQLRAASREFIKLSQGTGLSKEEQKVKELKAKERELVGRKIDGYFPTPQPVIEKMMDEADVSEGMDVLEPSAGKGSIADQLKDTGANVSVIEINSSLRDVLEAKGYDVVGNDFLEHTGEYDRIVMNPPFEKLQDVDHVNHAFEMLKPGGKLVAITSESPFFRKEKKAQDFRDMVDEYGHSEKLPDGSFKDSDRSTGVATRMVVLEKPEEETSEKPSYMQSQKEFTAEEENEFQRRKRLPENDNALFTGVQRKKMSEKQRNRFVKRLERNSVTAGLDLLREAQNEHEDIVRSAVRNGDINEAEYNKVHKETYGDFAEFKAPTEQEKAKEKAEKKKQNAKEMKEKIKYNIENMVPGGRVAHAAFGQVGEVLKVNAKSFRVRVEETGNEETWKKDLISIAHLPKKEEVASSATDAPQATTIDYSKIKEGDVIMATVGKRGSEKVKVVEVANDGTRFYVIPLRKRASEVGIPQSLIDSEPLNSSAAVSEPVEAVEEETFEEEDVFDDTDASMFEEEETSEAVFEDVPEDSGSATAPQAAPQTIANGATTTVKTERGTSVDVQYAFVELDELIASHTTDGKINPSYPKELQPRDRSRKASEDQINRMANKLEPSFLGASPKASEGAPIVGEDMVVESGNGRTLAIQKAYDLNDTPVESYYEYLVDNAASFGLTDQALNEFTSPVLVRVRKSNVDRVAFTKESNEASVAAMSATEQAQADAEKMSGKLMELFAPDDTGNILSAGNRDFRNAFMQDVIGPSERGRYLTNDGTLSQEGVTRIRNAVFAKAYGDTRAIETLAESTDNNVKNITNAMLIAAPRMAQIKEGIEKGNLHPLDLAEEVSAAVNKLSELRNDGVKVETFLNQTSFFEEELSPAGKEMLQFFDSQKRYMKKITTVLLEYSRLVEDAGDPKQLGLFEQEPPTKEQLLELAFKAVNKDDGTIQANLFEAETKQDVLRDGEKTGKTPLANEKRGTKEAKGKPKTLEETRRDMGREINRNVSSSSEMGITASIRGGRRRTDKMPKSKYAFSNETTEIEWQNSMEVKKPSVWERVTTWLAQKGREATREFAELPHTKEFAKIRSSLLRLEAQENYQQNEAIQMIDGITADLTTTEYDLFNRMVVLNDLVEEMQAGHALPYKFDEATLTQEYERLSSFVEENEVVQKALDKREEVWESIKEEYVGLMKKIGFDVADRFNRENYFRHIVIEKAEQQLRERAKGKAGSKLETPSNSSYLKRREGSSSNILAEYLEAETEVMAYMLFDIEVAKTIGMVDKEYNIAPKLKKQADAQNEKTFKKYVQDEIDGKLNAHATSVVNKFLRQFGLAPDPDQVALELDGDQASHINLLMDHFKKMLAISYGRINKMAKDGLLPDYPEYQGLVDQLKQGKRPDNNVLFPYLSKIAGEDAEVEPGVIPAKTVLKYTGMSNRFADELIKPEKVTVQSLMPEGYTEWQPREGNIFFMQTAIGEEAMKRLFEQGIESLSGKSFKEVMVVGPKRPAFIVKEEVQATLDDVYSEENRGGFYRAMSAAMRAWKPWALISPTRFVKYNLRNITGDLDKTLVGNPAGVLMVPEAASELFDVMAKNRAPSEKMRQWAYQGGFQSLLQTQELGEIKHLNRFKRFKRLKQGQWKNLPQVVWDFYWGKARGVTDYREAVLRYANYLSYLKQIEKSENGKPKNYGASHKQFIDGLSDKHEKAFQLSNDLLIAYNRTSHLGKEIRQTTIPFWSFMEGNFKTYVQVVKNAAHDEGMAEAVAKRMFGAAIARTPMLAYQFGSLFIKIAGLTAMLAAFNAMFFEDEEKELPEDIRNSVHIVLGRDKDGNVLYFDRLGTLQDFLGWFGLDHMPTAVASIINNEKSLGEYANEYFSMESVKKPINKIAQSTSPFAKQALEQMTGKSSFPSVFQLGNIRDRYEHFLRLFGLNNEYAALKKKYLHVPDNDYKASNLFIYSTDPEQGAYYDTLDVKREFQSEVLGKGSYSGGVATGEKSQALYYFKLAVKTGDKVAAEKYLKRYALAGGTEQGMSQSIKMLDPLYGLNEEDKEKFMKSLSEAEKAKLEKAQEFYENTLRGDVEMYDYLDKSQGVNVPEVAGFLAEQADPKRDVVVDFKSKKKRADYLKKQMEYWAKDYNNSGKLPNLTLSEDDVTLLQARPMMNAVGGVLSDFSSDAKDAAYGADNPTKYEITHRKKYFERLAYSYFLKGSSDLPDPPASANIDSSQVNAFLGLLDEKVQNSYKRDQSDETGSLAASEFVKTLLEEQRRR